jgi:hypothetical protein
MYGYDRVKRDIMGILSWLCSPGVLFCFVACAGFFYARSSRRYADMMQAIFLRLEKSFLCEECVCPAFSHHTASNDPIRNLDKLTTLLPTTR